MLTLRLDQIAALADLARDALADRVVDFLRTEREELVAELDEDRLQQRVAAGLACGWARGIRQDVPLIGFAAMLVEFGPRFDRHSAVAAIMADPDIAPDDLVDALLDRLPRLVWEELEILGAGADWDGF
jgi:hypothetical protein